MSKYDPLRRFLRRRSRDDAVTLRFDEIELILGAMLPKAARDPAWWSNAPPTGRGYVQCDAWLVAGFEAELVEPGERVQFRRKKKLAAPPAETRTSGGHVPMQAARLIAEDLDHS